jgi:Family of unknown function (DUF6416)
MAIVTIEVPDELIGDIYIAAGQILRDAEEGAADERRFATGGTQQGTTRAEPRPGMVQVTFEIPDHLLGRFYVVVGATLNRARPDAPDEPDSLAEWDSTGPSHVDNSAHEVWRKFSPKAQTVFSLLIDNPGLAITGEDIASKLDIPNGKRGVAGIVAWPARHCADAGYVPLFRCEDSDGGYWMDPDTADLFARVRNAARPRPRHAT